MVLGILAESTGCRPGEVEFEWAWAIVGNRQFQIEHFESDSVGNFERLPTNIRVIHAVFNQLMDVEASRDAVTLVTSDDVPVAYTLGQGDRTLTLRPMDELEPGSTLVLDLGTGVQSWAGGFLERPITLTLPLR